MSDVGLNRLARVINIINDEKGWNDDTVDTHDPTWLGAQLALIHSEVSEALEDVRDGNMVTQLDPRGKPCGFPSELADTLIRVLHLAARCNIDIEHEVHIKLAFNKTRPARHGGKTL